MVKHAKMAKRLPRGMFSLENRARQNQLTLKAIKVPPVGQTYRMVPFNN